MLCIQCGTDNPEGAKYCLSCNAMILQAAPTGNPSSSTLDINEDFVNPVPDTHYQSPVLQHLAWTIHEFMEEGGELEHVIEAYEAFREIFEGFKSEIPKIEDLCYSQQGVIIDDEIPDQIKYMITQAQTLYTEGEALFEAYFDSIEEMEVADEKLGTDVDEELEAPEVSDDAPEEDVEAQDDDLEEGEHDFDEPEHIEYPDPQPLVQGIQKWLDCNDRVCVTYEFLVARQEELEQLVEDYQFIMDEQDAGRNPVPEDEEEGAGPGAVASPPPPTEEEPASPAIIPGDSTDLA